MELAAKHIQFLGFMEILTVGDAIFMAKKCSQQTSADYNLVEEHPIDRKYSVPLDFGPLVVSNKPLKLWHHG